MAADSKNTRSQSRLEKAAREDQKVRVHYEVEARTVAEKTARLRALRLAKEAADKTAADNMPATSKKPKAGKKRPKAGESLSGLMIQTPPADDAPKEHRACRCGRAALNPAFLRQPRRPILS